MDIKQELLDPKEEVEDILDIETPAVNTNNQIKAEPLDLECQTCGEKFINAVAFKIHEMIHREDCYCFVCKRNIIKDFQKHVRDQHMNNICTICNNVYPLKKTLNIHINSHKKEKIFKCDKCDKSFMQKGTLNSHVNVRHKGFKPFVCEKCGETFTTSSSLKRHVKRVHSGTEIFECEVCLEKFCNKAKKNDHEKAHKDEKPFICEICKQMFARKEYLQKHQLIHLKTATCEYCKRMFLKSEIATHVAERHQARECPSCKLIFYDKCSLRKHQVYHQKRITCKICNRSYKEFNMNRHLKSHVSNKVQRCELCHKSFVDIDGHNARVHKNTRFCFCPLCPKKFPSRISKIRHFVKVHNERGTHKCKLCGKTFAGPLNLSNHMNMHYYPSYQYKCFICRRRFKYSHSLEKHVKCHDKRDLKYKCTSCGKSFNAEKSLKKHKCGTFRCYLCDIKYTDKHYLKRHMILFHSPIIFSEKDDIEKAGMARINFVKDGSKKFQCKKCHVTFTRTYSFKIHFCNTQTRTSYSCPVCQKRYKIKKDLVEHLNEKHPDMRPKCDICGLFFLNKRSVRSHYMRTHVINKDKATETAGIVKEEEISIKLENIENIDRDIDICIKPEFIKTEACIDFEASDL